MGNYCTCSSWAAPLLQVGTTESLIQHKISLLSASPSLLILVILLTFQQPLFGDRCYYGEIQNAEA